METKFNFKSQICTSIEQSERLLTLGLKKETADMCLDYTQVGWIEEDGVSVGTITQLQQIAHPPVMQGEIPAWSLHRLIEMMPKSIYHNKKDWSKVIYNCSVSYQNERYSCYWSCEMDLYTDIINCIEWLIKEGYFNKEYMEE